MTLRRIVGCALSAGLLAASLTAVTASTAHADETCSINDFSPKRVEIGLTPKVVTFPSPSVGDCNLTSWSIQGGDFSFYVYADNPEQLFYVPYANGDTKLRNVIVKADNEDYHESTKVFKDSFRLVRNTTWDKFNASPEPVSKRAKITVKGRLRIVDWTNQRYTGYKGHTASLQFRTKAGSYKTVKTVTAGSGGYLRTTVSTIRGDGYWRFYYGGNSVAGRGATAGDYIEVK